MKYFEVSPATITHMHASTLTYNSELPLRRGQVVRIEVGKKLGSAVVLAEVPKPSFETKAVVSISEEAPLPESLIGLHDWLADYYATHSALVWHTILPRGIEKKRRTKNVFKKIPQRSSENFSLNTAQSHAVKTVLAAAPPTTYLLHGATGSGKTAVYTELARRIVARKQSVIFLVPEISLTPQLIADIAPHFKHVLTTHSTMSEAERHRVWKEALYAKEPVVVIGPRSALFTPVQNLGLVIIDECHEPSFKQEQAPRYSALRAASILCAQTKAHLVLGSATPSVADYYLASIKNAVLELPDRARPKTTPAEISLVDMTARHNFSRSAILSDTLVEKISATLIEKRQVLLFHNRRGSAPVTLCENCGWSATCPRCYTPLTLHADRYLLRCHLCNHQEPVPTSCPSCRAANIIHKGIGTKRIEEELRRLFPNETITRFDGDSDTSVETEYQALYDGDIRIIIGTQVIAKGLDLPHLRLVGIIQADSGLALPDYQSSERVFQLLAQVVGRVGRSEHASSVVIQSYQPDHPSVQLGVNQDYARFYTWCLAERKRATFPPFSYLLRLTAVYKTEAGAIRASRSLIALLRHQAPKTVTLLGPAPSFYERLRDTYRWQIIAKSPNRSDLAALCDLLPSSGWQAELDPVSLI